ncbi:hypothetical protein OF83DRAFT_1295242 [Amylostereum chailletii]|nr:hypothetical protein OF83DRAFT_1295242 [Amylostereum chailletii]
MVESPRLSTMCVLDSAAVQEPFSSEDTVPATAISPTEVTSPTGVIQCETKAALSRTILSLTHEAICNIIDYLPPTTSEDYISKEGPPPRIAVTFVCKRLRQVGTIHNAFWSHIPIGYTSQWFDICLKRASSLTVDLSYQHLLSGHQDSALVLRFLSKHAKRVTELNIDARILPVHGEPPSVPPTSSTYRYRLRPDIFTLVPIRSVPCLETLSLDFRAPSNARDPTPQRLTTVPATYFSSVTSSGPRLKSLTLGACNILASCPLLFPTLNVLKLDDCAVWSSLGAMRDTLAAMPALRVLALRVRDMDMSAEGLPPLTLPCLKELDVEYPIESIIIFLELLRLSPGVRFRLVHPRGCVLQLGTVAATGTRLGNALKHHLPLRLFGHDGSLRFGMKPRLSLEGRWSAAGIDDPEEEHMRDADADARAFERVLLAPPDLTLVLPPLTENGMPLLTEMFAVLGFSRCRALAVVGPRETYCARALWKVLSKLRNIDILALSCTAGKNFLDELERPKGYEMLFAPRVLLLTGIVLRDQGMYTNPTESICQRLSASPGKLKHLSVRNCPGSEGAISIFREQLGSDVVHWDGCDKDPAMDENDVTGFV